MDSGIAPPLLFVRLFASIAALLIVDTLAFAQTAAQLSGTNGTIEKSFVEQAQPLLNKYCLRCHNADVMKSGIRVDQLDGSLRAFAPVALNERERSNESLRNCDVNHAWM